jgi:hypothetical protein
MKAAVIIGDKWSHFVSYINANVEMTHCFITK